MSQPVSERQRVPVKKEKPDSDMNFDGLDFNTDKDTYW